MVNYIWHQNSQAKNALKGEAEAGNIGRRIQESILNKRVNTGKRDEAYEARLAAKVRAGKRLSGGELDYIRVHMPGLYAAAMRMMAKRQAVEQACKACKTKQEVDAVFSAQMRTVSEEDPDKEMLYNVIREVVAEVKDTEAYKALPEGSQKENGEDTMNNPATVIKGTEYRTEFGTYQELYEEEEHEKFYASS